MGFLSTLGSIGSAVAASPVGASLVSGLFNLKATDMANKSNESIVSDTNAMNLDIANQNLAFQRENLDYQKALQQQIFEREDTAYERTVEDMRNAGLSPLSMQSTNGAGQAIDTQALSNDMQYQGYTAQSAAGAFDGLAASVDSAIQNSFKRDELYMAKVAADVNNRKVAADTAATEASTEAQVLDNQIKKAQYDELIKRAGLDNANVTADTDYKKSQKTSSDLKNEEQKIQNAERERKYNYEGALGIVGGMSTEERLAQIALKELGVDTSDSSTSDIKGFNPTTNGKISQTARIQKAAQAVKKIDTALGITSWLKNLRSRDVDADIDNMYYEGNKQWRHYDD